MHLCKSLDYCALIFKSCAASEVTIEKYVGSLDHVHIKDARKFKLYEAFEATKKDNLKKT